jgi:hypothetical protein
MPCLAHLSLSTLGMFCPAPSRLVPSCPFSPRLVSPRPVMPRPAPPMLVSSYLAFSHIVCSGRISSYSASSWPRPVPSCLAPLCSLPSSRVLPRPVRPCLFWPCLAVPCLALPCLVWYRQPLIRLVLSQPVGSCLVLYRFARLLLPSPVSLPPARLPTARSSPLSQFPTRPVALTRLASPRLILSCHVRSGPARLHLVLIRIVPSSSVLSPSSSSLPA